MAASERFFSQVGSGLTFKHYTKLEMPAKDTLTYLTLAGLSRSSVTFVGKARSLTKRGTLEIFFTQLGCDLTSRSLH